MDQAPTAECPGCLTWNPVDPDIDHVDCSACGVGYWIDRAWLRTA